MLSTQRFSSYRIMWLMVVFDLPVVSATDRKNYARFRKELMADGFTMMQYSVYLRHAFSGQQAETHVRRVRKMLPPKGQVSILQITDRQYADIINFWQADPKKLPDGPRQLEMF